MQFLNPWMLAALALCGIPILIHLFHRRRYQLEPWAAMRFVRAALERRSRQIRLESLVLLLLRGLIIGLVVLAAAEPVFRAASGDVNHQRIRRILLLDLSASMGRTIERRTAVQHARDAIRRLLAESRPGDSWQLVRIAHATPLTIIRLETFDIAEVEAELNRWDLTSQRGDVAAALAQTLELIEQNDPDTKTEVIVFSDLQRSNWIPANPADRELIRGQLTRLARHARLRFFDLGQSDSGNLGIVSLQADRSILAPGQPAQLTARVRSDSASAQADLEWWVDGVLAEVSPVRPGPTGETTITWTTAPRDLVSMDVEARLRVTDTSPADDRRFLSITVTTAARLLVVEGRPTLEPMQGASDYLQVVLEQLSRTAITGAERTRIAFDTTVVTGLQQSHLDQFDVVWLCGVPTLDADDVRRLSHFVRRGGGLIISLADGVDLDSWRNALNTRAEGAFFPVELGEIVHYENEVNFAPAEPLHPLTLPFKGNEDAGLTSTLVSRAVQATPRGRAAVALRLSTGDPAIVEQPWGEGRVIVTLTSIDDRWTTWPVWPSFPPLVSRLLALSLSDPHDQEVFAGDPIVRSLPPELLQASLTVTAPDGQKSTRLPACDAERCHFEVRRTSSPGHYLFEYGPPLTKRETVAVNVDPVEFLPQRLDQTGLATELLPSTEFDYVARWQSTSVDDARGSVAGSLAAPALAAALVLLLIEQLLAWRFHAGMSALIAVAAIGVLWQMWKWHTLLGVLTLLAAVAILLFLFPRWRSRREMRLFRR